MRKCATCVNWYLGNCERLDEPKEPLDDVCCHFFPARYVKVDVSGTGFEHEIKDTVTGELLGVNQAVRELNRLNRLVTQLELRSGEPVNCHCLPVVTDGVTIDHPVERDCVSVTIPEFELEPIEFDLTESQKNMAKRLLEAIRTVCPKCPECGADLSRYWNYDSQGREFQYCPKCRKLVKR